MTKLWIATLVLFSALSANQTAQAQGTPSPDQCRNRYDSTCCLAYWNDGRVYNPRFLSQNDCMVGPSTAICWAEPQAGWNPNFKFDSAPCTNMSTGERFRTTRNQCMQCYVHSKINTSTGRNQVCDAYFNGSATPSFYRVAWGISTNTYTYIHNQGCP